MKVAILGAGMIAERMSAALRGLGDEVEMYAVASRDLKKAQNFADNWGYQKAYGSYEEMLQDDEVDLVYVATPHSHHFEHAKMCIEAGKSVLCEKAFTANAEQARELLAFAEEKKVFLTEAIWTRYMPVRQIIDDVIASGIVGKANYLKADLSYNIVHRERIRKPELAGGALLDIGIYPMNFASMVFGDDIEEISGTCVKLDTGVDGQETITIRYKDGKVANLSSTVLALGDRKGVIFCENGYIEVKNINCPTLVSVYDKNYELIREIEPPKMINGYEYEVMACKRAIAAGELECYEMPHAETIKMMEWMDKLRKDWGIVYPFE